LSFGNVASGKNAGQIAQPKAAALQGLAKMDFVRQLGVPQAFFPPQPRPIIPVLQQLGFGQGSSPAAIAQAIDNAYKSAPHLLASCYSASAMWAANAATVSPSADSSDQKLHLTPANLTSNLHRSLEAGETYQLLRTIFHNETLFDVHKPLPPTANFSDEGAANHMRVCNDHGHYGSEVFVYGAAGNAGNFPKNFPARQQREAGLSIARMHALSDIGVIHLQQNPSVIDQGVFHNDVIAMNTTRLMIAHADAFLHKKEFVSNMERSGVEDFCYIEISGQQLSIGEAVSSYLFNSQLLHVKNKGFVILAPAESETSSNAHMVLRQLVEEDGVVQEVHYLNLRESMRNGGGPACLRLRVVMTEEEEQGMHQGVILTDDKYKKLHAWVETHYRDRLALDDLRDPLLIRELDEAYAALESIIELPGYYTGG
jgi:succinylarginine dihydrolase